MLGAAGVSGTFCGGIIGVAGFVGDPDIGPKGTPADFGAFGLWEPGRKAGSELRMPGFVSAKCLRDALGRTP